MTGTCVKRKRQIITPPPRQKTKETIRIRTWLWHPPPPGRGSGGVLPCGTRHAPSTATKAGGTIGVVTWRTDPRERGQCNEGLIGKEGRVPLPVPVTG